MRTRTKKSASEITLCARAPKAIPSNSLFIQPKLEFTKCLGKGTPLPKLC
jgi:hypothetical protein